MIRVLLKDSVVYVVPVIVTRGLSLLLLPLYTRVLYPADYGALELFFVFCSFVNLAVTFEVSQGLARYYTTESDDMRKIAYASTAFWFACGCYALFAIFAYIFADILSVVVMGREGLIDTFRVGLVYVSLNGIFSLIQNQFRWDLRSIHYATVSLVMAFSTVAMVATLVLGMGWGLDGLLGGMVCGSLVGVVYGGWHLRASFQFQFDTSCLKEMLAFSAPLVPSGIAVFISAYVDRMMINHFLSISEVGFYGIGFRIASVAGLAIMGFQMALTPLIYAHYRDANTPSQLARIFRIFLAFVLCVYLVIVLFAKDVVSIIAPPDYYEATTTIVFLVPAILLSQMYIFAPGIDIAKKTHLILWINAGGAVVNALLNWSLIPILGVAGAALGTFLGAGCVFASYMFASQYFYYVPHRWGQIFCAVSVVVVSIAIFENSIFAELETLFFKVTIVLLAGLAFFLIGLVKHSDFQHLRFGRIFLQK